MSFKPFKIEFKKVKDGATVKNNYIELNKVTLVRWVHKVLDQTILKYMSDLNLGLHIWIFPLNPKVIDEKFSFVEIYKTQPTNKEETKHSNSEYEEKEDQQWSEELIIEELLNK